MVFSPLLLLLAVQGGFTSESKFAFVPLDGDAAMAVKKSASNDDLQALAEVLCLRLSTANPCMVPLLQVTQQACTHYLTLILSLVRLVQAATQAQYYKYDELDQDFPDDESVGAATVKSMPVVASTAGMLLCVCIYVWVCA